MHSACLTLRLLCLPVSPSHSFSRAQSHHHYLLQSPPWALSDFTSPPPPNLGVIIMALKAAVNICGSRLLWMLMSFRTITTFMQPFPQSYSRAHSFLLPLPDSHCSLSFSPPSSLPGLTLVLLYPPSSSFIPGYPLFPSLPPNLNLLSHPVLI